MPGVQEILDQAPALAHENVERARFYGTTQKISVGGEVFKEKNVAKFLYQSA